MVKGQELELTQSALCKPCAEEYLNKHSTICGACNEPIIPGTPVGALYGKKPENPEHNLVHYSDKCSIPGSYMGVWTEGKVEAPVYG